MKNIWVFGYGSLMWKPGFPFLQKSQALLHGAHRSLCVYSWVHRGTEEKPGLVFGLDHGGSCRGMVFEVSAEHTEETIAYLREREQSTMVYREAWRNVVLPNGNKVEALCYLVDRQHTQYAGVLPTETQFDIVSTAIGKSGKNPEYVLNTADHLEELKIHDRTISTLAKMLRENGFS